MSTATFLRLEQLFAEVFFRDETITAFRFHPAIVASMGENGKELAQVINLEKPFRIGPEIPKGHKQCSRRKALLPEGIFPKWRGHCPPCYKRAQKEKRERAKARGLKW